MSRIKQTPKILGPAGKKFWRSVLKDYDLEDGHHFEILKQACTCLDRISEARDEIEKNGAYFIDRWNQPKESPYMKNERDQKILFARLLRELCLDIETPKAARPPDLY